MMGYSKVFEDPSRRGILNLNAWPPLKYHFEALQPCLGPTNPRSRRGKHNPQETKENKA